MSRILIPSAGPESWKTFLADEGHWKTGFSAKSLAHCWEAADEIPPEIDSILRTSPTFVASELLLAIPEHKVRIPGGSRASQTDLWLLLRAPGGLASVAIEGKVKESFGPTVAEWSEEASSGKEVRLQALKNLLSLSDVPGEIRYQLLHRTASAILEARRFLAVHAVMLVHSFSQSDEWFDDFKAFSALLGASAEKGKLVQAPSHTQPTLHLGWVRGDAEFLTK